MIAYFLCLELEGKNINKTKMDLHNGKYLEKK